MFFIRTPLCVQVSALLVSLPPASHLLGVSHYKEGGLLLLLAEEAAGGQGSAASSHFLLLPKPELRVLPVDWPESQGSVLQVRRQYLLHGLRLLEPPWMDEHGVSR